MLARRGTGDGGVAEAEWEGERLAPCGACEVGPDAVAAATGLGGLDGAGAKIVDTQDAKRMSGATVSAARVRTARFRVGAP